METKAQRKAVEEQANDTLTRLARHERNGMFVVAIHGLDAETVCVCGNAVDAEVITRALNQYRKSAR